MITSALAPQHQQQFPGKARECAGRPIRAAGEQSLAASGLCEQQQYVTAESLPCLEHVTAPDSSPIVPPGAHTTCNLLPPRRRLGCTSCWTRDKTRPPTTARPCYPTPSTPTLIFAARSTFERAPSHYGVIIPAAHGRPPAAPARARPATHQP